ncbi:MAG: GNAT family N-acetyltransferase [Brevibacterium sp.]|uniref:GNAT family N-acetyltransferase n=1 Tax=Brevibacterium sp. TaxID=1701 RepID=UPI00264A2737|nr:GNAT family N-acetyltransferase [Brevibacterium sp.]MDN5876080.1 GNAT family N-acetyltransferase [Brevibacterium sp.]MDN5908898.1 GNAT family N-acetyltransferase [Brevibacterium sp.]MDN6132771.1 GNAT family N-acetyltransferase [Brevibacterium sp.]MDN6156943.1 GNAT family N-acetyltransferase [Brevibacterium sp.]MDN6174263.1 GNAT family N-acetyltransferase [Brevibacterium sp.]
MAQIAIPQVPDLTEIGNALGQWQSDDGAWTSVHWSAFRGTPYTADDAAKFIGRWETMSTGPFSSRARSLLGYDDSGRSVAAATVWSAGPARPGLLEPLAVHRDHHGRGFGKAMAIAAAKNLQQMGSSAASVAAESANTGAVAAYAAAGFIPRAEVRDLRRPK